MSFFARWLSLSVSLSPSLPNTWLICTAHTHTHAMRVFVGAIVLSLSLSSSLSSSSPPPLPKLPSPSLPIYCSFICKWSTKTSRLQLLLIGVSLFFLSLGECAIVIQCYNEIERQKTTCIERELYSNEEKNMSERRASPFFQYFNFVSM